jgi:predicted HicB family RNase H-like nuclease
MMRQKYSMEKLLVLKMSSPFKKKNVNELEKAFQDSINDYLEKFIEN